MSRIGKQPIIVPSGVEVVLDNGLVKINGPKGELNYSAHPMVKIDLVEENGQKQIIVTADATDDKFIGAVWGTTRANISNIVTGVTQGFEKKLEVIGVGYKASVSGNKIKLELGFSHPIEVVLPDGIKAVVENETITISGIDKQVVGEIAANIRALRKPEPYKGKGVRYKGEVVRKKVGKAAAKSE
ncbi:MAG: ribosomal protein L6 [uncultured bacterium]|nr:MAG: ribosomal protein L6 [uncultured bacterium]HBD05278.1 50S ribosomal protein L6 [Candidatus Uhrbacteria bacterium]